LENLDTDLNANKAWETIREIIKISAKKILAYYEFKKHKAWLQDPNVINGNNLHNIRRETSRHIRNKQREYLKDKIDELATNN
jgi:hypothetical protein